MKRRCERLLETAVGAAARLPRRILELIDVAFALRRAWRGHRLSGDELAEAGLVLADQLDRLVDGNFRHEPNRRLAAHVREHALHWFWFLIDPAIDATNYRAEQAIRPAGSTALAWFSHLHPPHPPHLVAALLERAEDGQQHGLGPGPRPPVR